MILILQRPIQSLIQLKREKCHQEVKTLLAGNYLPILSQKNGITKTGKKSSFYTQIGRLTTQKMHLFMLNMFHILDLIYIQEYKTLLNILINLKFY